MSAKITIPDELKADMPANKWGKILAATPIVMTVIATLLAGLSSGEMTRAQYDRALAAQLQSKAGDQWSYFQAKRLRAALQRNTLDVVRATTPAHAPDPAALAARLAGTPAQAVLEGAGGQAALPILAGGPLPAAEPEPTAEPKIAAVLSAVESGQPESQVTPLLVPIKDADLAAALAAANARVRAFDAQLKPISQAIDAVEKELHRHPAADGDALARDFVVGRLGFSAQRYDAESRQNQIVAQLLELQVRKGNISAERHHLRSQRFFYGMLAAQLAVIISTFSMAARKHNYLWALAATAGAAAVGFATYVYLFI